MARPKWTPGPYFSEGRWVNAPELSGRMTAEVTVNLSSGLSGSDRLAEAAATARLFASAPALYEALRKLLELVDQQNTVGAMPADKAIAQGRARAALELAEGAVPRPAPEPGKKRLGDALDAYSTGFEEG